MSPITTIIILGIVASIVTSVLTVAAAMLSSRISEAENIVESYPREESPQGLPRPYTLNG